MDEREKLLRTWCQNRGYSNACGICDLCIKRKELNMQLEHHFAVAVIKNCHEYLLKIQGQIGNQMIGDVGSWGLFCVQEEGLRLTSQSHAWSVINKLFPQVTSCTLEKELKEVIVSLGSEKIVFHPFLFNSSYASATDKHDYPFWVDEEMVVRAITNDEFATHKLFAPGMIEILKQVISE